MQKCQKAKSYLELILNGKTMELAVCLLKIATVEENFEKNSKKVDVLLTTTILKDNNIYCYQ